jgi:hypothetical protein
MLLELICELAEPIIEIFGADIMRFFDDLFADAESHNPLR